MQNCSETSQQFLGYPNTLCLLVGQEGIISQTHYISKMHISTKICPKMTKFLQKNFNWHTCLGMASFSCRRWRKIFDTAMGLIYFCPCSRPFFFFVVLATTYATQEWHIKPSGSRALDVQGPLKLRQSIGWLNRRQYTGHRVPSAIVESLRIIDMITRFLAVGMFRRLVGRRA
jgi:hypothetical protein